MSVQLTPRRFTRDEFIGLATDVLLARSTTTEVDVEDLMKRALVLFQAGEESYREA